ncbi:MAG TPA: hypothetical protein VLH38_05750 [Patescibacteria group bacterium]|nr:hypothetical protein [Patescibacteria group bacterium]
MLNEMNAALSDYELKWKTLAASRKDRAFFDGLLATSVGWKVSDPADFDKHFAFWRAYSDQVHLGWVNERWLATFHMRDQKLNGNISLVKLMQVRPGSSDRLGLDHVDFIVPVGTSAAILKTSEPDLNVTEEANGKHAKWISIWFGQTEAKLRSDTVLDVCIAELNDIKKQL